MIKPKPFKMAQVIMIRFSHALDSSTVFPDLEKFIRSKATEAVTTAAIVEIRTMVIDILHDLLRYIPHVCGEDRLYVPDQQRCKKKGCIEDGATVDPAVFLVWVNHVSTSFSCTGTSEETPVVLIVSSLLCGPCRKHKRKQPGQSDCFPNQYEVVVCSHLLKYHTVREQRRIPCVVFRLHIILTIPILAYGIYRYNRMNVPLKDISVTEESQSNRLRLYNE